MTPSDGEIGEGGVPRTEDGRHIVVNGRRWRASDPAIPEALRQELVNALMAARRAVRTEGDAARPRVHDAKVALGERGRAWWEPLEEAALRERSAATIRTLLRHRDGSICPSDAARVVGGEEWRDQMDLVRDVAFELAARDAVQVTRGGIPVSPGEGKGPVRIVRGAGFPDGTGDGSG